MNIKKIRIERGLTQPKFAELLGVGLSTVQSWESKNNPRVPHDRNIFKIEQLMRGRK